jgi:hypothetical protein
MSIDMLRNYIRLAVGLALFLLAVYLVIVERRPVADVEIIISALLGIFLVVDAALRTLSIPNGSNGAPKS